VAIGSIWCICGSVYLAVTGNPYEGGFNCGIVDLPALPQRSEGGLMEFGRQAQSLNFEPRINPELLSLPAFLLQSNELNLSGEGFSGPLTYCNFYL
jgi:hypothetical protein